MKKIICILGTIVLVQACAPSRVQEQCDKTWGYCMSFGSYMNNKDWTDNWTDGWGLPTNHSLSNGFDPEDDKYVGVDISTRLLNCNTDTLGARDIHERVLSGVKVKWVKMEENNMYDSFYDAVCYRYHPKCTPHEVAYDTCNDGAATYALCSEKKNSMTVFICMNQLTDNPEMAKQIFESFRWTR